MKKTMFCMILFLMLLSATACGKRGPLEPPPGADPQYPRHYPN